jgi:hypothetical protein
MPSKVVSHNSDTLREWIFFSIKNAIDKLLPYDENMSYENP